LTKIKKEAFASLGVMIGWMLAGCGSGEDPRVQPRTALFESTQNSGNLTFLQEDQPLSFGNSVSAAVQTTGSLADQWVLYILFGSRTINTQRPPSAALVFFMDEVLPSALQSIELPAGQVQAELHLDFNVTAPVTQAAATVRTRLNQVTGGYFIIEPQCSGQSGCSDRTHLQVRLYNVTITGSGGEGVLITDARIPFTVTRIAPADFLNYVHALELDRLHLSTGGTSGGGIPQPPSGGGFSGGGGNGLPPAPPST